MRPQPGRQGVRGVADGAQVQGPVLAQGRGSADHGRVDAAQLGVLGGGAKAAGEHPADLRGGEGAVHGWSSGAQVREGARVGVVADGVHSGGGSGLGEREAEMAEADDGEICGHGVVPSFPRRFRMA